MGQLRAKLVQNQPDLLLDSVCDPHLSPATVPRGCYSCKDYHDILARKPEILFVCTPNYLMAETVVAALDGGAHVFSEKPPGRNVAETKKMLAAEARNPHLKLKFGFNHRYHDSVMQAYKLATSGRLGKILSLRGVYGKSGSPQFEKEWRNQPELSGGGILLDQGIHMLDLMLLFCHEFTEIKSFVDALFWPIPVEDNAFVLMRNPSRQVGMLQSSATQWKHTFNLEITLEHGYLALKGLLTGSKTYGRESLTIARKTYEAEQVGNPQEEVYFFDYDSSWDREIEEFVNCVKQDIPIQIGSSKDALKVMELVHQIYLSDEQWSKRG